MVVVFSHGFKKLTGAECRKPKSSRPNLGLGSLAQFVQTIFQHSIGVHKFCGQMISMENQDGCCKS